MSENRNRRSTADRICTILKALQFDDELSLSAVAQVSQIPKSSAYRILDVLGDHQFVERDQDSGSYRLGLGFVGMQSRCLEILRSRTRPNLRILRDKLGETANLGVLVDGEVVLVDIAESHRDVRQSAAPGRRHPIHATALGKAIAAYLPEDQVRKILTKEGMPRHTENTISTIDEYLSELTDVQMRGFAVDNRENDPDGRCIAVPLLGVYPHAALSISAPAARFPVEDAGKVAETLWRIADSITPNPTQRNIRASNPD